MDAAYPLLGKVEVEQGVFPAVLDGADGVPGAVMDGVLADQMGLALGARFKLGLQDFVLTARLLREPDSATGGFALAPRTMVRLADLKNWGLLGPGTCLLYTSRWV